MSTAAPRLTRALVAAVVAALLLAGVMAGLVLTGSATGFLDGHVLSQNNDKMSDVTQRSPVYVAEYCPPADKRYHRC